MKIQLTHTFEDIVSIENLLEAWKEFVRGKRNRQDVHEFSLHLMDNILALHDDLLNGTYRYGGYHAFTIDDPKPRNIHKASVRDRLLHHALYRKLYPFFDKTFISDSFSCRIGKGTHKALDRFHSFSYTISKNNIRTCWVLKCDIQKFFANIDHAVLIGILQKYIHDERILLLLKEIIYSFSAIIQGVGLPLGNLTSQLFVNIYLNKFDQFVKHNLKVRHYIRYTDDFVLLSEDKYWLENLIPFIKEFLHSKLGLSLHSRKVLLKTFASGVDFLGWVHFPDHRVLRTATKRKMMRKIRVSPSSLTIGSYLGMLSHGNANKLQTQILKYVSIFKRYC